MESSFMGSKRLTPTIVGKNGLKTIVVVSFVLCDGFYLEGSFLERVL